MRARRLPHRLRRLHGSVWAHHLLLDPVTLGMHQDLLERGFELQPLTRPRVTQRGVVVRLVWRDREAGKSVVVQHNILDRAAFDRVMAALGETIAVVSLA